MLGAGGAAPLSPRLGLTWGPRPGGFFEARSVGGCGELNEVSLHSQPPWASPPPCGACRPSTRPIWGWDVGGNEAGAGIVSRVGLHCVHKGGGCGQSLRNRPE